MRGVRRFGLVLALLLSLMVSAQPVLAVYPFDSYIPGGVTTVNADTAYTMVTSVTNNTASSKTLLINLYPPVGWYFNGPTTVDIGILGCSDPYLRVRNCQLAVAAGATRYLSTPTAVGQGIDNPAPFTTTVGEVGGSAGISTDNFTRGSGTFTFTWDADVFRPPPIEYQHSTAYQEWLWLTINYPSARTGKITFWVGNLATITGMSLCKSDGSGNCIGGNLGTFAWTDGAHHGANITYASWDSSLYRLSVTFSIGSTTGTTLMQSTFVDASNYRSSDQSQNNIVN